ncbi:MAG TPA: hypothetical protein VMF30_12545, partial [Pirellulales bacterium]|nr:hypothetical protein [Pirellulales bacterium]
EFHRHVVDIQASILAEAGRKPRNRRPVIGEGRGLIAADLIWAFTRADRDHSDRLVYEEVSSELLDNRWHMVRRRRSGPVDVVSLPIVERYILVATAAVLVGPEEWLRRFYPLWAPGKIAIGMLEKCLNDADRAEFVERRQNWSRDRALGSPAKPVNYPG